MLGLALLGLALLGLVSKAHVAFAPLKFTSFCDKIYTLSLGLLSVKVERFTSDWLGLPASGIVVSKAPARICYTFSMVILRVSPFFKS